MNQFTPASHFDGAHSLASHSAQVQRVLRNTYALLSLTLLFAAGTAALAVSMGAPRLGLIVNLVGVFGLFFLVNKVRNSGWAIPAVFALTGFMGFTLAPQIAFVLAKSGGADAVMLALAATGVSFLGLSAIALTTKRDFSFMGKFLMVGMLIAFVASLGAFFFEVPALALVVSGLVALLSAGLILYETSNIVNGGERNYVMATVGLFLSIFNLFSSLLAIFGFTSSND